MKAAGIRLPQDLIGDDGLIGALAKTNLGHEDQWDNRRVVVCADAGFRCEPVAFTNLRTWRTQYKRMINYSVRHYQNRIISAIMRGPGPQGLPPKLSALYPAWLPKFTPRRSPSIWWFDRQALKAMRDATLSQ